jgi:hypothetical protein
MGCGAYQISACVGRWPVAGQPEGARDGTDLVPRCSSQMSTLETGEHLEGILGFFQGAHFWKAMSILEQR